MSGGKGGGSVVTVDFSGKDPEDVNQIVLEAMGKHPAGKAVDPNKRALMEAVKWSKRIEIARDGYHTALVECRRLGMSYGEIARHLGKTEAAIRAHFRRREP